MGYSVTGDATSFPFRELVYSNVSYFGLSIDYRLSHLSTDEENVLRITFLSRLAALETAYLSASDNLDTDRAAVWYHNKDEVRDRKALFNDWRRQMCTFLGFRPGPALEGGIRLVRC